MLGITSAYSQSLPPAWMPNRQRYNTKEQVHEHDDHSRMVLNGRISTVIASARGWLLAIQSPFETAWPLFADSRHSPG